MERYQNEELKLFGSEGNAARKLDPSAPVIREWVLPEDPMAVTRRIVLPIAPEPEKKAKRSRFTARQRFMLTAVAFVFSLTVLFLGYLSGLSIEKAARSADKNFSGEMYTCRTAISRMEGTPVLSDVPAHPQAGTAATDTPFREFVGSVFSCFSTLNYQIGIE